jgi:hypothetical protein
MFVVLVFGEKWYSEYFSTFWKASYKFENDIKIWNRLFYIKLKIFFLVTNIVGKMMALKSGYMQVKEIDKACITIYSSNNESMMLSTNHK